jgi:hypothetical protein
VKHTPGNINLDSLIAGLAKTEVKVGIFDTSHYTDGTPIAYIYSIQELGYARGNIPPRPTLHPAMNDNRDIYQRLMLQAVTRALSGGDLDQELSQIGETAKGHVQRNIRSLTSPALLPSTLAGRASRNAAGKSSTKPLVDTGAMLQAISYAVEK